MNMPNRHLLSPKGRHANHDMWNNMLLVRSQFILCKEGVSGWVCFDCLCALDKNRLPKFLLANSMWIGEVPYELKVLTFLEQLLVALHYPRCFVFKLYPKRGEGVIGDPQHLQRGMAGNVSCYELNNDSIVDMLEGNLMPPDVSILASVIAVTFVSGKTLPKKWLKQTFNV
jgi:hypothetical protein